MSTLWHFLAKEATEIQRTWRLWTIGGVLLFFAVMSPLAALAAPALVSSVTSSQPGVVIKLPDPTYLDSYAQWIKNLSQMGLLLVVFASAGLIANERASGTALLVVTKPVSRPTFVVAKYLAQATLVVLATALGTAAVLAGTRLAFGTAPVQPLLSASGAWLAGALIAIAATEALSAVLPTLAAGIVALVAWGLSGALSLWEPAVRYTPVALLGAPSKLLAGESPDLGVPLAAAVALTAGLVAVAAWLFSRREF